jgi:hypothetical protein
MFSWQVAVLSPEISIGKRLLKYLLKTVVVNRLAAQHPIKGVYPGMKSSLVYLDPYWTNHGLMLNAYQWRKYASVQ